MAEFDRSWPGWQFSTRPEDVVERLADPLGGIALVETGVNIHPTLHAVAEQSSDIIRKDHEARNAKHGLKHPFNERSEAFYGWGGTELRPHVRGATPRLKELTVVTKEIRKPIEEQLMPPGGNLDRLGGRNPHIVATRRSQPTPNHVDEDDISTFWFGATQPALKVLFNGQWIDIDDVPVAHALVWRGDSAHDGTQYLDATRHIARYRSRTRRVIALA